VRTEDEDQRDTNRPTNMPMRIAMGVGIRRTADTTVL
jgi:hypothetical protein